MVATVVAYFLASMLLFGFGLNLLLFSNRTWRRAWRQRRAEETAPDEAVEVDARECATDDIAQLTVAAQQSVAAQVPFITVQLPIYNELYVSTRIIEAACAFDWPRDRLEIQVLDDSTDETSFVIADAVARAQAEGLTIHHMHRSDREGYKAGALREGLAVAKGEYVAIFDADFVPPPDFLRRTVPHFVDDNVAFVQTRWGHLNRESSWLTRLQAMALDAHFLIDQASRGDAGYWFNFNGTAGIWRAEAIADAGGWRADTLTEDLDLSYRAHLRGWRATYLEDVVVPAELPVDIAGFRRQQHRWARGSIECALRLLPAVLKADAPLVTRYQAAIHLTSYGTQLLLGVLLLVYPPLTLASIEYANVTTLFGFAYVFASVAIAPTLFFWTGRARSRPGWIRDFPRVLLLSVFGSGLMLNTARAWLQILTKPTPEFERTAKFGIDEASADDEWHHKRYQLDIDRIVIGELAFGLYGMAGAVYAWVNGKWGIAIYAFIFASGLLMVAATSIQQALTKRAARHSRNTQRVRRAVVVMAKQPSPGMTKTRLAPAFSLVAAAELYERFLLDTIELVDSRDDCELVIAIDQPESAAYFRSIAPRARQVLQVGDNLGERLDTVMTDCLDAGYEQVFALGSDSPDLPPTHLSHAFVALSSDETDVVLGPTEDGGYYLIGWKQRWSRMVTDVQMSTESVLTDSLQIADVLGARVDLAPTWYDIDHPDDVERLRTSITGDREGDTASQTADYLASLT